MLKKIVDDILRKQNRSLSWLASEMGKTFDGLKLSLVKESIKYVDLRRMAEILEVSPAIFFDDVSSQTNVVEEEEQHYSGLKIELRSCRELAETLKSQLKDKEHIIRLLLKES